MSFNSPAKQERIERHLMRQRGAGVRTVSANFGFAFGSSAPPASDPTATQDEPPAKRRKTLLRNGPNAPHDVKNDDTTSEKATKTGKSRRNFLIEEERDKAGHAAPSHEEDSFGFGLETRKKAGKKTNSEVPTEDVIEAAPEVLKPLAKGRARKRAVATTAAKAGDGLAEEPTPMDRKCRAARPKKELIKPHEKDVVANEEETHQTDVEVITGQIPPSKKNVSKKSRGGNKRKVQSKHTAAQAALEVEDEVENHTVPHSADVEQAPSEDITARLLDVRTEKRSSKRMKKKASIDEGPTQDAMVLDAEIRDLPNLSTHPTVAMRSPRSSPVSLNTVREIAPKQLKSASPEKKSSKRIRKEVSTEEGPTQGAMVLDEEIRDLPNLSADPTAMRSPQSAPVSLEALREVVPKQLKSVRPSHHLTSSRTKRKALQEMSTNLTISSESPEKAPERSRMKAVESKTRARKTQRSKTPDDLNKRAVIKDRETRTLQQDSGELVLDAKNSEPLPEITELTRSRPGSRSQAPGPINSAIATANRGTLPRPVEKPAQNAAKKVQAPKASGDSKSANERSRGRKHSSKPEISSDDIAPTSLAKRDVGETRLASRSPVPDFEPAALVGNEEDVDWLFAPAPPTRQAKPKASAAKTSLAAKCSKSRGNLVEIDLDDLISNIASYAKEQTSAQDLNQTGCDKKSKASSTRKV